MELYTLVALAEQFGVKEPTIRHRIKLHSEYIETVGRGKNRRYTANALPVIEFIMDCYDQNMKSQQIGDLLAEKYPKIIDVAFEETAIATETENTNGIENVDIDQLKAIIMELKRQNEENSSEIELLRTNQKSLESKLDRQGESHSAKINDMTIAIGELSRAQRNKGILTKLKELFS